MSGDEGTPDLLLIGSITADIDLNGSKMPGGTVFYSAITAARLGIDVGVAARSRDDIAFDGLLDGVQVAWVEPPSTLSFRNIYQAGERVQYIQNRERGIQPLGPKDIPTEWTKAPMVHLAPVANDVEPSLAGMFKDSTVLATPQGWLRTWDNVGRILFMPRQWGQDELQDIRILVLSDEDINNDQVQLNRLIQSVPIVVLTTGSKGCKVYSQGLCQEVPAFPTTSIDPTGAGDSFATAFLVHYYYNHNPTEAAIFANCVASFTVEGRGASAIPTLHDVERRLRENGFTDISLNNVKINHP